MTNGQERPVGNIHITEKVHIFNLKKDNVVSIIMKIIMMTIIITLIMMMIILITTAIIIIIIIIIIIKIWVELSTLKYLG